MPFGPDIALSSHDAHTVLEASNSQVAADPPAPDTLNVIDLSGPAPHVVAKLDVPGSVVGPPTAVWCSPDASWAIVTSATRADAGSIMHDDRVSVIALDGDAPRIEQRLMAGAGATTVRVSPDGTLALVANRFAGSVSVFALDGRTLDPIGTLYLGSAGPSGIGFFAGGKRALVSCHFDHRLAVLRVEGGRVTLDPRPVTTGVAPYTLEVNAAGTLAAVSNMGRGDGDLDTVSLIDLGGDPPRCVATVGVGWSPEGLRFSPDGRFLAVVNINGTTRPPGSPFLRARGELAMFSVEGARLIRVCDAPIGRWSQGAGFSRDGRTVLVQNMVERTIDVFAFDGSALTRRAPLTFSDGPAAMATPW